jgi:DNA-binding MarR family transcriptional regulator
MTPRRAEATAKVSQPLGLDPILDFMRLLWSVEHGLQSTSKRMEATLGITGPQRLVLRIVTDRPGLSAGELAQIVHLHPSTITGILERLVRKGLLRRERDRRDNRRVQLRSRVSAERFVAAADGTVEAAVTRALATIPRRRVRHAREVLSALAEALMAPDSKDNDRARTKDRRTGARGSAVGHGLRRPPSRLASSTS